MPAAARMPASNKLRNAMQCCIMGFAIVTEFVGVVISVGREQRRHRAHAPACVGSSHRSPACSAYLRSRIVAGTSFCARSTAVRYMSIATSPLAWQFTWMPARCTRSTHAFRSCWLIMMLPCTARHPRIRHAQRHRALRKRSIDGVLGRRAERLHSSPKPLCMPASIKSSSSFPARLIAHPMEQFAASSDLLEGRQVAPSWCTLVRP